MMGILLLLFSAFTFLPCCSAIYVEQDKKLLIVKTGEELHMKCTQDQSDYLNMIWYQQKPGQGLKLMVLSVGVDSTTMEKDYEQRWSMQRPTVHNSTLTLTASASAGEDSAVYFCAARDSNQKQEFGPGTVLSVLGENEKQKPPSISIYRPSKRELEVQNFISLVCVASNFFPEHVKIRWFVNYAERINLYEPVPQRMSNNSAYSTSKRLTLTREEYFNPDSRFRCNAAFLDGNYSVSEEIKGETDCGISNESYTMYINQGKISYIMVLCKSGLYALVVLVLVWRKKVVASSY